jgi:hypothetical protein
MGSVILGRSVIGAAVATTGQAIRFESNVRQNKPQAPQFDPHPRRGAPSELFAKDRQIEPRL